MGFTVAVVGVTGAVGQEMLRVLERRGFPVDELRALASARSAGRSVDFHGDAIAVRALDDQALDGVDIALVSAGSATSKAYGRAWAERMLVIDNSSAFRMDQDVPLVVPEINAHTVRGLTRGLIANPNCTTAISLMALYPIHRAAGLARVIAASYQASSGAGAKGMAELEEQARAWARGDALTAQAFPRQLFFNCLPHVDVFLEDGFTREEMKLVHESRKILEHPALRCAATCVRVPVLRAHAVALHVETERPLSPADARAALAEQPGVRVVDDPAAGLYPTQLDAAGLDEVLVGRIRKDPSHERGLALWVVGDQLLKGAALNAVQCAEAALGLGPWSEARA